MQPGATSVTVGEPRPEGSAVAIPVEVDGDRHLVTFRFSEGPASDRADAGIPVGLLAAMALHVPLRVQGGVSPRLMAALPRIQELVAAFDRERFHRDLAIVDVEAEARTRGGRPAAPGVGCFFSGGIDSFFTALSDLDEITHLIFIHGFLARPWEEVRTDPREGIRAIAAAWGKEVVEVETDLRTFSNPYTTWRQYHGPCLIAAGLLLAPRLRRIVIPSSLVRVGGELLPLGSHPELDPLWSTEDVEIVHGPLDDRFDKLAAIATNELALTWLQVCNANTDRFNCGACDKCLCVMAGLRAVDALDRCRTFDRPLDLKAITRLPPPRPAQTSMWEQVLRAAERDDRDPELARAIRARLARRPPGLVGRAARRLGGRPEHPRRATDDDG